MSDPSDFSIQQHTPAPLRLELKASFRVPPQVLFKIVSDHHAVASWVPLMQAVSMEHRQGGHDGECGVGSVRHCTLRGMGALDETIVWWNPPHGYAFRVAAKSKMMMPTADHVSDHADRTWRRWRQCTDLAALLQLARTADAASGRHHAPHDDENGPRQYPHGS